MANCCSSQTRIFEQEEKPSWSRYVFSLIIAGQMMVLGLAINLTPPSFGSFAYYGLHGFLLVATILVSCMLGRELLAKTFDGLRKRKIVCEHFFFIAIIGAFMSSLIVTIAGQGSVYYEVVAILLVIYALSRMLIQRYSAKILEQASQVSQSYSQAWIESSCGCELKQVPTNTLNKGDVAVVPAGEPVTVDGVLLSGQAQVCSKNITGELSYRTVHKGEPVYAGYYATESRLYVSVEEPAANRELDKLLNTLQEDCVEDASLQNEANRIAAYFTPAVLAISSCTFFGWLLLMQSSWHVALYNSMAVLLVACPCAFGLATPLALRAGYTRLAEHGLLQFKPDFLSKLAACDSVYIDRAGTLTESCATLQSMELHTDRYSRDSIMEALKLLEQDATHPFAQAIRYETTPIDEPTFFAIQEAPVKVVSGVGVNGLLLTKGEQIKHVWVGNHKLFEHKSIVSAMPEETDRNALYVTIGREWVATLHFEERLRAQSNELINSFSQKNLPVEVITGGNLDHDLLPDVQVQAELMPAEKRTYIASKIQEGHHPLFIGDGLNDAAVSQTAHCSIALNSGDVLTQHVADGVISPQVMNHIPSWFEYSKHVIATIRTNLKHALCYNVIGITLAVLGILHPVVAALLMAASSTWVSFRSARLMHLKI